MNLPSLTVIMAKESMSSPLWSSGEKENTPPTPGKFYNPSTASRTRARSVPALRTAAATMLRAS